MLAVNKPYYPLDTLLMRFLQIHKKLFKISQTGRQAFARRHVSTQTSGRVPQYCLKAPRQVMSFVLSSSGVSMNILNTEHIWWFSPALTSNRQVSKDSNELKELETT